MISAVTCQALFLSFPHLMNKQSKRCNVAELLRERSGDSYQHQVRFERLFSSCYFTEEIMELYRSNLSLSYSIKRSDS